MMRPYEVLDLAHRTATGRDRPFGDTRRAAAPAVPPPAPEAPPPHLLPPARRQGLPRPPRGPLSLGRLRLGAPHDRGRRVYPVSRDDGRAGSQGPADRARRRYAL